MPVVNKLLVNGYKKHLIGGEQPNLSDCKGTLKNISDSGYAEKWKRLMSGWLRAVCLWGGQEEDFIPGGMQKPAENVLSTLLSFTRLLAACRSEGGASFPRTPICCQHNLCSSPTCSPLP